MPLALPAVAADPNAQQSFERLAKLFPLDETNMASALAALLGISQTGSARRGKSIIATSESTGSTTYTTLTTPDQVANLVLPTDGLLVIAVKALWSVGGAVNGLAALFLNSTQLTLGGAGAPANQEVSVGGSVNDGHLATGPYGLQSMANTGASSTDVTTGQIVGHSGGGGGGGTGLAATGGFTVVFAAAGTYTVSLRFRQTGAGTVQAKNRKLWAMALGF